MMTPDIVRYNIESLVVLQSLPKRPYFYLNMLIFRQIAFCQIIMNGRS